MLPPRWTRWGVNARRGTNRTPPRGTLVTIRLAGFGEIELEPSRRHRVEPEACDAARQCFDLIGRPVDTHSRILSEGDAHRDLDRENPKYRAGLCRSQFHDPNRP